MIKVMTSSCLRDIGSVAMLHEQLSSCGIEHHIFVEYHEVEAFYLLSKYLHVKPSGGDNGGGRDGTMVRWSMYQQMLEFLNYEDTVLQLDSDVLFGNIVMLSDLACASDEAKGFYDNNYELSALGHKFRHMSGMLIASGAYLFEKSIPFTSDEMYRICTNLLDAGVCPSEDVVLSYLLQAKGNGKLINLSDKYTRSMSKEYTGKFDVEC